MADVAIIGAGVVECSLACHLARAGARVEVFDKGNVCSGMSACSGALVRMHYTFEPEAALALESLRYFRNWKDVIGGECGFVQTGFAIVVDEHNAARLRANVAMLKRVGVENDALAAADLRKLEPEINVEGVALAAYEPLSGYADPVATTRSLADAARRAGAQFHLNCTVNRIEMIGGRVTGVTDVIGTRHASDRVCVVAGPWTDHLLAPIGCTIGIRPERAQIAFFRRSPATRHCVVIDTIAGSYFRPHGDSLTLVGLGDVKSGIEQDPDRFAEQNDEDFLGAVRTRLAARIPKMSDAVYSHGHAGIYDVTVDARAALGPVLDIAGLFVAAGFSGTGFKTAPAVGAAMAELMLEGKSRTVDLSPFAPERFREGRLIRAGNEYSMGAAFGHTI